MKPQMMNEDIALIRFAKKRTPALAEVLSNPLIHQSLFPVVCDIPDP